MLCVLNLRAWVRCIARRNRLPITPEAPSQPDIRQAAPDPKRRSARDAPRRLREFATLCGRLHGVVFAANGPNAL